MRVAAAGLAALALTGLSVFAQSAGQLDPLLKILVENKVITEQ